MHASIRRLYVYAAVGIAIVTSIVAAIIFNAGRDISDDVLLLYKFVIGLLVVVWLTTDPDIPDDHRPSLDHGMLQWMLFPLLATYQQFKIRRWRGIGIVLGLLGLFVVPYITLVVLYAVGEPR
jgi:hypothetical protein